MSTITRGSFKNALRPGLEFWWGLGYNEKAKQFSEIFKTIKTDSAYIEMASMYGFGLPVMKLESAAVQFDTMAQAFSKKIQPVGYALAFAVSHEQMVDNKYAEVAEARMKSLGKSMRQAQEIRGANVLNNGFSTDYLGADGAALFSTSHVRGKGGTYANKLSVAADLSEASLEQICINIRDLRDESGHRSDFKAQKLIVHASNEFEAARILKSNLRYDTANNDINALKDLGSIPQGYRVNDYLTDSDAFFVLTDCANGFIHAMREAIEITTDDDFHTNNTLVKAYFRDAFDWVDPKCAYASAGA
jgi:hypothetical protein